VSRVCALLAAVLAETVCVCVCVCVCVRARARHVLRACLHAALHMYACLRAHPAPARCTRRLPRERPTHTTHCTTHRAAHRSRAWAWLRSTASSPSRPACAGRLRYRSTPCCLPNTLLDWQPHTAPGAHIFCASTGTAPRCIATPSGRRRAHATHADQDAHTHTVFMRLLCRGAVSRRCRQGGGGGEWCTPRSSNAQRCTQGRWQWACK
jgi:hypothetical protein